MPRQAGKTRSFLETKDFAQGAKVRLPMLTIQGARPGRRAVIVAAQHGRELNGIAAIEKAFTQIHPRDVAGSIVFFPVMNPLGVRILRQEYPQEAGRCRRVTTGNYNINRGWPSGRTEGYAAQVAHAVWNAHLRHADLAVDLHGWSGISLCLAWAHKRDRDLLRAFGLPWHLVGTQRPKASVGLLESAAWHAGIPCVTCELVPQNVLCNESVEFGRRGVCNVLRHAGILAGDLELPPVQYEFDQDHQETEIRVPVEGLVVSDFTKGQIVEAGQTVCRVLSLEDLRTAWEFRAPHRALIFNLGGVIWGEDHTEHSVVFPGQLVGLLKKPSRELRNS